MKALTFLLLASFLSMSAAQDSTLDAFQTLPGSLQLTRPAQPLQYFDKIGRRAAIMGYESGTFEAWIWPWKPLKNFELSFLLGNSTQPLLAKDLARSVSVTPEATVFTYTHESFTVKEILLVPVSQAGVIILLDIRSNVPLTVVSSFIPVMQPQWPAGIGGQFSYWDETGNAYVISEGRWRAIFLCGSPSGEQMAAPPAHMFADNPLQFKIEVKPNSTDGKFIPIVIAGGQNMKMDSARALYRRLWTNAAQLYHENVEYYQNLRASTLGVITPDQDLNLAYEWGKVALDNLVVSNPKLGTGLVAGYGLSGGGGRPGFAWFFGGDAFINALAFDSYGATSTVRDALAFTQKWQRQKNSPILKKKPDEVNNDVGKMAHELSQSEGLVDWWNDYHYGYNHADTTPWYIVATADYVRVTNDREFLRDSWSSLKQAYDWCLRKDSDGDGLMDLKGAGLGALEFGKLVGIYADMYTSAIWTKAVGEMNFLAGLVGDTETKSQTSLQREKALASLEQKFWMPARGFYSYGATVKNEQVQEKTPWPATAMMFQLLNDERTAQSLEALNDADLSTDWGTRSLSPSSALFDPTNYNYGSVWAFLSTFVGTAQYRYHYAPAGYATLQSVVQHVFDHGLGVVPEVFSGQYNTKLGEAYHHQGFSTTGYMVPFVRGMLGLSVDATDNSVSFSPHLPANWDSLTVTNIHIGNDRADFVLRRTDEGLDLSMSHSGRDKVILRFNPALPPGAEGVTATLQGKSQHFSETSTSQDKHVLVECELTENDMLHIGWKPFPEVYLLPFSPEPGAENHSLKFIASRLEGKKLRLQLQGVSGETYLLGVRYVEGISSVRGGELKGKNLTVHFGDGKRGKFLKKMVEIEVR
ncbi:MAG: amylo-alpha-1,6-glucosidase [Bacteroidota bacterium]